MGDGENQNQIESTNQSEKSLEVGETSQKIIRLITVVTYLFSVSAAAIMLSLYYIFFWNPTVQSGPERLVDPIQLHFSQIYFNQTVTKKVSRGSTNGAVSSEIKFAGNDKEKMYEPKHRRKLVRVLTVIAYLFSVSLAAIMLSLFYIFIYSPGKPAGENDDKFSQLLARTRYHRVSKESLDLMNDTHLNLEREEPRALPFKGFSDLFTVQSDRLPEDDLVYFNYSDKSEKENKIIFKKL